MIGAGSALLVVPKSAWTANLCPHPLPRHWYVRVVSIIRTGPVRTHVPDIWTTVPTSAEAGFGNFKPVTWFGIFARSGVPPHILKQLNEAVREVMQSSQTREYLKARGATSSDMGLDEFQSFFHAEIDMWADVIRKAQIKQ